MPLGNFYGVTGYGDAFGGATRVRDHAANQPRMGRRLSRCVRSCKTLLDNCTNWQLCIGGLAIVAQLADALIRRAFSAACELLFLETELILSLAIEIAAQ
jgi:hypothetical protein